MKKIEIEKELFKLRIEEGLSNPELAKEFNCSVRTIANRKTQWGFIGLTPNNKTSKIINETRECLRCNTVKPLSEFGKQSSAKSGYRSACKSCRTVEAKEYYKENKNKIREKHKSHYNANKDLYNEKYARRRAAKKQAIPAWFSIEDKNAFISLAEKCKELEEQTGEKYEIDHIIPLQSNTVCGLHCRANWQILTRQENRSKGNKYE